MKYYPKLNGVVAYRPSDYYLPLLWWYTHKHTIHNSTNQKSPNILVSIEMFTISKCSSLISLTNWANGTISHTYEFIL